MAYNSRTRLNVSEYVAGLNIAPSAQELAGHETFSIDDDLAMFTNTQFYDFDLGQNVSSDLQQNNFDIPGETHAATSSNAPNEDLKLDFGLQGMFQPFFPYVFIIWCLIRFPAFLSEGFLALSFSKRSPEWLTFSYPSLPLHVIALLHCVLTALHFMTHDTASGLCAKEAKGRNRPSSPHTASQIAADVQVDAPGMGGGWNATTTVVQ
jgi:hypothetical protein